MIYVESYVLIITVQGMGCLLSQTVTVRRQKLLKLWELQFIGMSQFYSITKLFAIVEKLFLCT